MSTFLLLLLFTFKLSRLVQANVHQKVPLWALSHDGNDAEVDVNLERINSYLANEHLPVWIVNEENPNKLIPLENIMNEIGPIHMYHDLNNCAAAIYFQKEQYFDGTIDQRYSIKNYNSNHNSILTEGLNMFPSQVLTHPESHRYLDNGLYSVEIKPGKDWRYVKSLIEKPNVVHVEILIVVNYDIVNAFQNNYKSLVSEMLVTFNSVDMLYGKIDKPNIKINIAGIIIGNTRSSFPIFEECYITLEDSGRVVLDVSKTNDAVRYILDSYQNEIPLESYDVVVFLSKFDLYGFHVNDEGVEIPVMINGLADYPLHDEFKGFTVSSNDIRICTVRHLHDFQHFPVIAHEVAHLFSVTHDPGQFRSLNKKCIGNLMRSDGFYCEKCIFFAHTSIKQMKRFFSSRDGCKFRNEPHSLNDPSKPRFFWNEHKQCQCYGFLMAKKPQKIDCGHQQRLVCLDGTGRKMETGFFMDGTICDKYTHHAMVCWDGTCKQISK